jgi:hypothetical protein
MNSVLDCRNNAMKPVHSPWPGLSQPSSFHTAAQSLTRLCCRCEVTDRTSPTVQVFGRRDDDDRIHSGGRRAKTVKAQSRGQFGIRPDGLLEEKLMRLPLSRSLVL